MVLKKKDSLFLLNWVFSNLDVHLSRSCDMGFFINENSASKQKSIQGGMLRGEKGRFKMWSFLQPKPEKKLRKRYK